jgi:hypothetical protein
MALIGEKRMCMPHAWVGEGTCPKCNEAAIAEEQRWQALSLEEKIEELHQILKRPAFDPNGRY